MARISRLRIKGYRSIRDACEITFPKKRPVVLIGENNAGKSNIVRALEIVLGDRWPTARDVGDHEFWDRDPSGEIEIDVFTEGLTASKSGDEIEKLSWRCDSEKRPDFRAFKENDEWFYCSKEDRQECQAMIVDADRNLSYQLSYSSKYTLLSRLMHRFHDALVRDEKRVKRLKAEFKSVLKIFDEVEEFNEFREGLGVQLGGLLEGMTYALDVDVSAYDPSNFFRSLRVLPSESGQARTLDELGTGQAQILALVFARAFAKAFYGGSMLLVIEEPEAHLHPLAQDWLARTIRDMAKGGLQILLTTHSPAFVDVLGLEGVVLVRKEDDATVTTQLTASELADYCIEKKASPSRTKAATICAYYESAATPQIVSGMFARKVVLVEGPTESLSLPLYLRQADIDTARLGIAIIPVHGKGNLAKWWRLFRAFDIPVYVIFDNDGKKDDGDGKKREDILRALGIAAGDIEKLLKLDEWLVAEECAIFGDNYESTLRTALDGYADLEEEGKTLLGAGKPLIAKYVADRIVVDFKSDGGKTLKALGDAILKLKGS